MSVNYKYYSLTYDLHGHLMWTRTGCQQLLGNSFSLCEAGSRQDGSPAVLVDHHGGAGVDVGPVENGLTELLHVPRSDGLRVRQLGGEHLHRYGRDVRFHSGSNLKLG